MNYNNLHTTCYIMHSDDDQTIVEDLTVGYDKVHNMIVLIEHTDYEMPWLNNVTYAVVNKHETFRLARRLKISMADVPGHIGDLMSDYDSIVNAGLSDVRCCFKDITEFLLDEGCHFRIVHERGC